MAIGAGLLDPAHLPPRSPTRRRRTTPCGPVHEPPGRLSRVVLPRPPDTPTRERHKQSRLVRTLTFTRPRSALGRMARRCELTRLRSERSRTVRRLERAELCGDFGDAGFGVAEEHGGLGVVEERVVDPGEPG